jgi:hypothetical protein
VTVFIAGLARGVFIASIVAFLLIHKDYEISEETYVVDEPEEISEITKPQNNYSSFIVSGIERDINFKENGELINEKSFKVLQTAGFGALVYGKDEYGSYYGMLYFLDNTGNRTTLYDDKIIKVPKGKEVRTLGVHQYTTRDGRFKTIPVIRIVDK